MRIYGFSPPRPLAPSLPRLRSQSGQYVPMTSMILFTAVLLMIAGVNIYRIAKAKLVAQNLADATALAVASLEAKAINTVVDRNEWMNNMYSKNYQFKKGVSLPNISEENKELKSQQSAQAYANLVATINRAQRMFRQAYDNFLGTKDPTASNGSGSAALADILWEIEGLRDPYILSVSVYNHNINVPAFPSGSIPGTLTPDLSSKLHVDMNSLKFNTVDVPIKVNGKPNSLTELSGGNPQGGEDQMVGWMHPVWDSKDNALDVQVTPNGGQESHWGAGVTIVKLVPLFMFAPQTVTATSLAYVVDGAGVATMKSAPSKPPSSFRPTFYATLAYHP
jgi:hypothetical protein